MTAWNQIVSPRWRMVPVGIFAGLIAGTLLAPAQPLRLAVLGDSLSAEYDSITGIGGVEDPTEYAAITVTGWESMSWVEVVGRLSGGNIDLGGFSTDLLGWGALRFSGYEYNFAVPGFTAQQFRQVVDSSLFSNPAFFLYQQQLAGVLQNDVDAAVIWLGGNEFRANYGSLYNGTSPTPLINTLSNDLARVIDWVRAQKAGLKIVVVNLPDLGATPDKQAAHPDPLLRANVTAATQQANLAISSLAAARGLPVADVYTDTARVIAGDTLWLGPVNLFPGIHADNHPRHHFTRDGLHPNTCLQAIMARRILETFNSAYATGIPPLTDGRVLNLIGINPLQPFVDWAAANNIPGAAVHEDVEPDGLVNLAEFLFRTDPTNPNPGPMTIEVSGGDKVAKFKPDADRLRMVELVAEWSPDLDDWTLVPLGNQTTSTDGTVSITIPEGEPAGFVRLQLAVRAVN